MSLLSSHISDALTNAVLKTLKNNNVSNVLDFCQEDIERLVNITKLSYKEILSVRKSILEKYAATCAPGLLDFGNSSNNFLRVPSCIPQLDELLHGGLACGKITEVCGLPGVGKTQLAFTMAANVASIHKLNVIYIDTKQDFSGRRVAEILRAQLGSDNEMGINLERIKVIRISDMCHLVHFLHELRRTERKLKCVRLIIVDSLPALCMQHMGESNKHGLGLLNNFVNVARIIGHVHKIAFLVINIMTRWMEAPNNETKGEDIWDNFVENRKVALGHYWQHIPCVSLALERPDETTNVIQVSARTKNNNYCSTAQVNLTLGVNGAT